MFDHQQQQGYALNTTSALVLQHCDGQTTPEQLMELLRQDSNVSHAQAEQLTWLALDELGKANLLEAGVARPRPLSSPITRRQMLTTFATAGAALAVVPMVALVTTQAKAQCPPDGTPMTYFLKVREFIAGLIEIPAMPITTHLLLLLVFLIFILVRLLQNIWQESQIFIWQAIIAALVVVRHLFLCYKNNHRFYTDISNYLSVDNGLIVSWFTPTTLVNLEVDSIINGMVTQCIVVAATMIGPNPFYRETFNLCVSSIAPGRHQIQFQFTQITS